MPSKKGGAAARRKGHGFERDVAKDLREIFPMAKRGLQAREGHECPDVVGCWPFWIECKRGNSGPLAALRQATEASSKDSEKWMAVGVCKPDRGPRTVTMTWEDWFGMVSHAYRER